MFTKPKVEFFCAKEDEGVIPAPYPAQKLMPDWFKHLQPKIENKLQSSTIKRCPPFLDAMCAGWIIPLAADVEFVTNEDASGVSYKWNFDKPMVENHTAAQIAGHGALPKPPMKWLNYWYIQIPKNHVALFVPPLNRPDERFTCFSGMVNAEYMGQGDLEYINFPFFFTKPNFTGIIKAGTPLVQLIVMPKQELKGKVRSITKADVELNARTRRRLKSHESHYRNRLWRKKDALPN